MPLRVVLYVLARDREERSDMVGPWQSVLFWADVGIRPYGCAEQENPVVGTGLPDGPAKTAPL